MVRSKTILDYTLLRELGKGGQGTVYYAENKENRPAAVKFLNPEYAQNTGLRQRFMREAQIMVQLNHTGICKAYHFYQDADQVAIIMEYLEGEDLQAMLDRHGPVQPQKAIEWFRQVLPAFQYAHDRGVIHRDVKPSNLFLTRKGEVKTLDFSIAKVIDPEATQMNLTGTQMTLGTPLYMSPEQITTPKLVDSRTDIYSLGVVLFTLIAGRPPFESNNDSYFELHQQIVTKPLPHLTNIPPRLNQVIAKATAKNRDVRYATCADFLRELEQVFGKGPVIDIRPHQITNPGIAQSVAAKAEVYPAMGVKITAFLMAPVSAYLMYQNLKSFGESGKATGWLIGGIVWTLYVLSSMLEPNPASSTSGLVIVIAWTWFVHYSIEKSQKSHLESFENQGGKFQSGLKIVGISVLYLIGIIVLGAMLMDA